VKRLRSTRRLAGVTLGGPPLAGVPAGLLVPMVRRALLTGRGPAALLAWLRGRAGRLPAREATERLAAALASDLLRLLADARPGHAGG
jgi:hypothetical protein